MAKMNAPTKAELYATIRRLADAAGVVPNAVPIVDAVAVPVAPRGPVARRWHVGETKLSRAGNPFVEFYTTDTKNGSRFGTGIPADLLAAIRAGKV